LKCECVFFLCIFYVSNFSRLKFFSSLSGFLVIFGVLWVMRLNKCIGCYIHTLTPPGFETLNPFISILIFHEILFFAIFELRFNKPIPPKESYWMLASCIPTPAGFATHRKNRRTKKTLTDPKRSKKHILANLHQRNKIHRLPGENKAEARVPTTTSAPTQSAPAPSGPSAPAAPSAPSQPPTPPAYEASFHRLLNPDVAHRWCRRLST